MFTLGIKSKFEAAHSLRGYPDECAKVHGHRWEIEAVVEIHELDDIGMGVDFKILKKLLRETTDSFDHCNLNDIFPFDKMNPTAENIAFEIFRRYEESISNHPVKLIEIKVWEGESSWACYRK